MKKRLMLLFSGGKDSTILLHMAKELGYDLHCLIFDYGQANKLEVQYGVSVCQRHGVEWRIISFDYPVRSTLIKEGSTPYNETVPMDHVPSRNLLFLAYAAGLAESEGIDLIWYGANYYDREALYRDCYQEWVYQLNKLLELNGSIKITVEAPLLGMNSDSIGILYDLCMKKEEQLKF